MSALLECPELECWQALLATPLPPEQQERCERHLKSCPTCQSRLDRAERGDALVHLARQVGDPTVVPRDPILTGVIQRLRDVQLPMQRPSADRPDLSFLGPPQRSEDLGSLGDYQVQGVIGQGGMGVVLKAFEPALHRLVAIKVLSPALAGSVTARKRFTREAKAVAAVCHDHVVAVHGVHEVDGLPYLVMQYVAGESLQDRLDRTGPLEVMEIVRIGLQTAQGLAAAHAQGLIHRDIKPANLLLEGEPGPVRAGSFGEPGPVRAGSASVRVKITDFGLARMTDDVGLTTDGVVAGTPEYMAPEQARAELVDHRADLFSLGSVLYACCTGLPPFRANTTLAVIRAVCEEEPAPIRLLNPDIPVWLEMLIMRLLAKRPADRFQSATEVASLLDGYLAHLRQPAKNPAPPLLPRTGSARWVRPRFVGALVLLMILGLGMMRWLAGGNLQEPAQTDPPRLTEYYHSFKGNADHSKGWEPHGPNAEKCVQFEPEGLRITLPPGWGGERPSTGVTAPFPVKGDFEITMSFEILKEPDPAGKGKAPTRLSLGIFLDTPKANLATLSRSFGTQGNRVIIAWVSLWDHTLEKRGKPTSKMFPTAIMSGQLRLVRTGSDLYFHVADRSSPDFTQLVRIPFLPDDLREIRIAASTGSREATLDARITDIRVRGESLPSQPSSQSPSDASTTADPESDRQSLQMLGLLFGALAAVFVLILAVWVYGRRRVKTPAQPKPTAQFISFCCSACGKSMKARANLAGKKGKCSQCGQAVLIPAEDTSV